MTPQEQATAKKIASLMRTARKRLGLTQVTVSQKLGISQSALSKMESALLVPSAPQWFEFCELTRISADSLTTGYIERNSPAVLQQGRADTGFKLANIYAENRGSKARSMLPFLAYLSSVLDEEKYEEYFKSIKVDPDYFVDLDNQISLQFCLDVSRFLISKGLFKPKDFPKLLKPITTPQAHGRVHQVYDGSRSSANLLKVLILNSRSYECNFSYNLEEQRRNQVTISVHPEKHLKLLNYKNDSILGDFVCQYKQHYFERFATYGGAEGGELEEIECHYKGADKCVYQLNLAS